MFDKAPANYCDNDSLTSRPKKRRISVACEQCRTRKLRCDGLKPACTGCRNSMVECLYRDSARRSEWKFKAFKKLPNQGKQSSVLNQGTVSHEPGVSNQPAVEAATTAPHRSTPRGPNHRFRIPFFRYFGPTGIAPGYKRMLFDVTEPRSAVRRTSDTASTANTVFTSREQTAPSKGSIMPFDDHLSLFEHDKITPRSEILLPLLDTFFDHFTCHFPFLSKDAVLNSVKSRKTSALLLNSMCALAARFSSVDELQSIALYQRGEAFGNRARMLLVPLMNLPSHDIVASILMITWHELAVNHDVGVWMYTGISCRMAVDLGMEKAAASEKIGEAAVVTVSSNLFWAVNLLNQIISLATGRPLTIRMDQVDVAYPEEPDCRDDKPSPFPSTIRIMQFLGLVGEAIGGEMTSAQLGYGLLPTTRDKLMRYSKAVIDYYTNIHPKLVFDIQNFRSQRDMKQSGAFLILHLWANAVMIAIHRPGLRLGQNGLLDTLVLGNESRELSISSARTISSILELAEMVDPLAVLASPFIDQAVEIAGLVFGAETKLNVANLSLVPQSHEVDRISHQSNYNTCVRTLEAVLVYWKGVGWTLTAMKQRYRGNGETDPAEESVDPNSMIVLNDTKMIQMLLEKVKATEESQGKMADTGVAIGVGVNGITDTSEGSITILGRHDPGLAAAHTSRIMDHFHIDHQNILATAPTIDVARMNPGYIGGNEDHINWSDLSVWDNVDIFQSTDNAFF